MRLLKRTGLQLRISLLAVLGLSAAFAAFAFVGLRAVEEENAQLQNERLAMAQTIAGELDHSLEHALRLLALTATREGVNLDNGDLESERHALEEAYLLAQLPTYRVLLLDRRGQVLLVEPDDPGMIGLDLSGEDPVRESLLSGRPGVSSVLPAALLGQPVVVIGVPVRDAQGRIAGALVQAVDLLRPGLSDFLRRTQPGEAGRIQIVDEDGTVIASTQPQNLFQKWEPRPVAFAPLATVPWGVAVEQGVDEALAPTQRLFQKFLFLGAAALLVALLLVWITTRQVIRPIQELSAVARRIACGELSATIVPAGQDEIGELVRAFEDMRVSLAARRVVMKLHTRELSVLQHTALACAEARDANELVTRVTKSLAAALYPKNVGFLFLDQEQKRLHFHPSYHGVAPEIRARTLGLGEGISGRVAQTGKPLLIPDVQAEPRYIATPPATGAVLCVPVRNGGQVAGVIKLESAQRDAFSREDLHLVSALATHVGIALENIRLHEETKRQAITDELTGLYNNRYFYQEVERELTRSQRYQRSCSLLILDLDDFKKYNDCYGHLAGDDLLRELGGLIRGLIRQVDTAARYGGEEFTVILPETSNIHALTMAHRLRETVRNHEFVIRGTQQPSQVTVSIGVATYPEDACNVEELVHTADMALLRAKGAGKDRVYTAAEGG